MRGTFGTIVTVSLACVLASSAHAATVGDADLFGAGQIATASNTFANAAFEAANFIDGTNKSCVFADGGSAQAMLSISGFNSSIDTLRFFDTPQFSERTARSVTVYYSSANQTSLSTGDYTLLGTFDIPNVLDGGNPRYYVTATDPADGVNPSEPGYNASFVISYSDLTGLGIPDGTQSILLELPQGSDRDWGIGLSEVQAFAVVPEPATMSLLAIGAAGLLRRRHRNRG